eukprot:SM000042S15385  [mRNA]  locus=s42:656320:657313:- [translate_table: standard]
MFAGAAAAAAAEASETAWMWGAGDDAFKRHAWLFCLPPRTRPVGRIYFWSYAYYLSKYYELLDTALLLLRAKPLTLLHVYHHALVLVMCYLWLDDQQSLQTIALLTNTGIHVVMYFYYFLHCLGRPPPWRKLVTNLQIVQFVFSFAVSIPFLYLHVTQREGCSGFYSWLFNVAFNFTLLLLFVRFHRQQYAGRRAKNAITAAAEVSAKSD